MKDFPPQKFGPKTWVCIIHGTTLYTAKYGNRYVQNRQRKVKDSIGNGEAKNLHARPMDMNQGWGDCWKEGEYQAEGSKVEKLGPL